MKVYNSGMEMSQRIHFWYQILLKMMIFWENGKKTLFGQKFLWQANKNSSWVKNAQISGKPRKDKCLGTDFLFFNLI